MNRVERRRSDFFSAQPFHPTPDLLHRIMQSDEGISVRVARRDVEIWALFSARESGLRPRGLSSESLLPQTAEELRKFMDEPRG